MGDVVELEAVLQPDDDSVRPRPFDELLQRLAGRFEMCGGGLSTTRLHLRARLVGAVVLDPRLPVQAVQLGLRARPCHLDFSQVDHEGLCARLGGPLDAAQGVLDRLGVLAGIGRCQIEVCVAASARDLYVRGRLVDRSDRQDAAVEDLPQLLLGRGVRDLDGVVARLGGVTREGFTAVEALLLGVHRGEGDGHHGNSGLRLAVGV